VASAISRLGETSSPERDCSSLKTKARRLSDSSRRKPGRASANLAQARHACLGKKTSTHHCSRVQQPSIRYSIDIHQYSKQSQQHPSILNTKQS